MAEKLALPEPNIIDPRWILNEDTGKLGYSFFRVVRSHPAQALVVSPVGSTKLTDRWLRIMADGMRRSGKC